MQPVAPLEIQGLKSLSTARALLLTFGLSVAIVGFLFWLLYFRGTGDAAPPAGVVASLPALNAGLNTLTTVFLVAGFVAVKRRNWRRHMQLMLSALGSSALFFVSYLVYHHYKGHTPFTGTGFIRPVYFVILISHVVLAALVVPLILLSFFTSLSGRLSIHRRLSRFTFPIWLYVSVTGVLVFVMLKLFSSPVAG
jgi:putative membrane protein